MYLIFLLLSISKLLRIYNCIFLTKLMLKLLHKIMLKIVKNKNVKNENKHVRCVSKKDVKK